MCSDTQPPNPDDFVDNYQVPLPWYEKARLTLKNNWIKLRTGSTCCGNHGEPGC